ncbi:hypothetical protein RvY_02977 [Ramazzottius varieornatus]|uniref:CutA1 divalent ion tolerance protein n=1 Tax=Ramazzottius varieornatus TaxID=947166 RepID=A0A1D1ULH6_RAMVA|nr:hypothetical protein RvY_02977 [Ramazzottius varieornatus]
MLGFPILNWKTFVWFWIYFFMFASVPSCMPVYASIHRLFLSGYTVSRVLTRAMSQTISDDVPVFTISYVTAPNDTVARFIARGLVNKKLAACVNIVPRVTSIYIWQNEVNEDEEVIMMIKSKTSLLEELTKFVRDNHPYDVCEVISTTITQGNPPYLQWLQNSLRSENDPA